MTGRVQLMQQQQQWRRQLAFHDDTHSYSAESIAAQGGRTGGRTDSLAGNKHLKTTTTAASHTATG